MTTKVTVILPIRNEASFIQRSLDSVLRQDHPSRYLQIIVADGMSDDGTRDIVRATIDNHPDHDIRFIDNPGKIVPTGFNRALAEASGEVVVRVDGHCEIEPAYVSGCLELLRQTGAECVGGVLETVGGTTVARAISLAQSSLFGVGGVAFRTGRDRGGYVDTVAFGAYRKDVFERIGLFDEELIRNQDDEFNFRLTQAGGRIWLDPSIRATYYSRASLKKLSWQYYQYGLYKVRVMQKRGAVPSWRHLVPSVFVIALVASIVAAMASGIPAISLLVLGPYVMTSIAASIWTARGDWATLPVLPVAFGILHLSYGIGVLFGLWRWRRGWGDRTPVQASFSKSVSSVQSDPQ